MVPKFISFFAAGHSLLIALDNVLGHADPKNVSGLTSAMSAVQELEVVGMSPGKSVEHQVGLAHYISHRKTSADMNAQAFVFVCCCFFVFFLNPTPPPGFAI